MTSSICEEFNLAPDVAERQDIALCKRIMALRRYRDSWYEVNVAKLEQKKLTVGWGLEKVIEVQRARMKGEVG
jgi:hypothetical protein